MFPAARKLSKEAHHLEHCFPCRRRGVETLLVQDFRQEFDDVAVPGGAMTQGEQEMDDREQKLFDALRDLVEQIELGNRRDDHGPSFEEPEAAS
jgi:hypothetical protein